MMLERKGYPAGVPCWVDTVQPDPEAAVAFYGGLFGWEFEDRTPAGAPGRYLVARLEGRDVAAVGAQPEPPTPAWTSYIWADSADLATEKVARAGGQVRCAPFDVGDAGRMSVVADPAGAVFCLWEANRHHGAQIVNAPRTWNWSNLHTRDLDAAQDFYRVVFGWEVVAAGDDYGLWKLPGYGDFLERFDPDLRRRHAQAGVPEGFSDVVAALVRTGEEAADVTPHWSVTFAVDGTDATVERAVALGATIVTPPFDAPPVREAVLADPQGAVFTVSTYSPGN